MQVNEIDSGCRRVERKSMAKLAREGAKLQDGSKEKQWKGLKMTWKSWLREGKGCDRGKGKAKIIGIVRLDNKIR